jgi:hypothetical protein
MKQNKQQTVWSFFYKNLKIVFWDLWYTWIFIVPSIINGLNSDFTKIAAMLCFFFGIFNAYLTGRRHEVEEGSKIIDEALRVNLIATKQYFEFKRLLEILPNIKCGLSILSNVKSGDVLESEREGAITTLNQIKEWENDR